MRSTRFMDRLFEPVQIVGGAHTRAIIHRATDTASPGDSFLIPKLECRVRSDSLLSVGSIITVTGGGVYLLGTHSSEIPGWKQFMMLPCDRQVDWKSSEQVMDTLTGVAKGTTPIDRGMIWVYWERQVQARVDLEVRIPDVTFLIATASPVLQGDTLNGMTVVRAERGIGLNVLGVRA